MLCVILSFSYSCVIFYVVILRAFGFYMNSFSNKLIILFNKVAFIAQSDILSCYGRFIFQRNAWKEKHYSFTVFFIKRLKEFTDPKLWKSLSVLFLYRCLLVLFYVVFIQHIILCAFFKIVVLLHVFVFK